MKKYLILISAAIISLMLIASVASAKPCGKVSITEMNWASSQIVTEVAKFIMEQGYGCKVTKIPSSTVTAVASLAETGKPDIITEIWILSSPAYIKMETEGKVKTAGNVLSDGGVEGWWIPQYLAQKHPELKTIEGILAHPKLVGGRFHNCPAGWACQIINSNLAKVFEFQKNGLELFQHGSGETLATSIASAYENKEPWLGYYWTPTDIFGKYSMVKVDFGPFNQEAHTCNIEGDCASPGKSSYPTARVVTGVSAKFKKEHEDIYTLMENITFTNQQMESILAWKKENKASGEEAAVYFLSKYKNIWKNWISKYTQAKFTNIL